VCEEVNTFKQTKQLLSNCSYTLQLQTIGAMSDKITILLIINSVLCVLN